MGIIKKKQYEENAKEKATTIWQNDEMAFIAWAAIFETHTQPKWMVEMITQMNIIWWHIVGKRSSNV